MEEPRPPGCLYPDRLVCFPLSLPDRTLTFHLSSRLPSRSGALHLRCDIRYYFRLELRGCPRTAHHLGSHGRWVFLLRDDSTVRPRRHSAAHLASAKLLHSIRHGAPAVLLVDEYVHHLLDSMAGRLASERNIHGHPHVRIIPLVAETESWTLTSAR